jgi:hypothetical protein
MMLLIAINLKRRFNPVTIAVWMMSPCTRSRPGVDSWFCVPVAGPRLSAGVRAVIPGYVRAVSMWRGRR